MAAQTVTIMYVETDLDGGLDFDLSATSISPDYWAVTLGLGNADLLIRGKREILMGLFEQAAAALREGEDVVRATIRLGNEAGSAEPF